MQGNIKPLADRGVIPSFKFWVKEIERKFYGTPSIDSVSCKK
jgi:hypothetical protein